MNPLDLAHLIVEALEDKKAEEIVLMDLRNVAMFTDYFVICNGTSDRMLDALAEGALDKVRETSQLKGRAQGQSAGGWVVVDFGSVVLHCFAPETRAFYKLEELWKEGKILLKLQ